MPNVQFCMPSRTKDTPLLSVMLWFRVLGSRVYLAPSRCHRTAAAYCVSRSRRVAARQPQRWTCSRDAADTRRRSDVSRSSATTCAAAVAASPDAYTSPVTSQASALTRRMRRVVGHLHPRRNLALQSQPHCSRASSPLDFAGISYSCHRGHCLAVTGGEGY
jgi:hypothetical protein